jgi:voltage-gated potassium channel
LQTLARRSTPSQATSTLAPETNRTETNSWWYEFGLELSPGVAQGSEKCSLPTVNVERFDANLPNEYSSPTFRRQRNRDLLFSGLTLIFLKLFAVGLWLMLPPLLTLIAIITLLGQLVGKREGWSRFDSFYWAFITATTVGYGDIRPASRVSRLVSILIALLGLMFTGIVIAVAVQAATVALKSMGP